MTKFNIPSLPGFGGSTPEFRFTPDDETVIDHFRIPRINMVIANIEMAVANDPGYEIMPVAQTAPEPVITPEQVERNQQMRAAVIGKDIDLVGKALEAETSQAEWIAILEQMAKDEADSHEYGLPS